MKIGVIGARDSIEMIEQMSKQVDLFVELEFLPTESYLNVVDIIKEKEKNYDGLLFTGTTPYHYASRFITPSIPWEYLKRNQVSFLSALLKAGYVSNLDITKVSVDSYDENMIRETYKEIGYMNEHISLHTIRFEPMMPNYMASVLNFHINLYNNKSSNLCITGLNWVYEQLRELKIPCVKINPSIDNIIQLVNQLRLRYEMKITEESTITVIALDIDFFDNNQCDISELNSFRSRNATKECIYVFAQKINAATYETATGRFILISTKLEVENITNNYKFLPVMQSILSCDNVENAYAGIGLGADVLTAQNNAHQAVQKAKAQGQSSFFVVEQNNAGLGPIVYSKEKAKTEVKASVNKRLMDISEKTKIGINTIKKLDELIVEHQLDIVTSEDLVSLTGLTIRSINRILSTLESAGYASFVGIKHKPHSGRPYRLIKLNINEG